MLDHLGGRKLTQTMAGKKVKMPKSRGKVQQQPKKRSVKISPPPAPSSQKSLLSSLGALALRGVGGLGGAILGNPAAGYNAGAGISKWLGMGDYQLDCNSIIEKAAKGVPFMHKTGQTTRIQHREYITDVVTSPTQGLFLNQQLPLNPGMFVTFPWLSTIASQYQEYTFKGLVFHYISTSGESVASTNTALGSVIMAAQYRSTALPFSNKTLMLNEYFSNDGKPSEDIAHPIECNPAENPFNIQYVRTGAVPSGEDEKMYDLGTFNYATVGYPSASGNIGELWVTYDIELRKPQVGASPNIQYAHYTGNGSYTTTTPLGSLAPISVYDTIGVIITSNTTKTITFPVGTIGDYMITVVYAGATAMATSGWAFGSNTSSLNTYRGIGGINSNYSVGLGQGVLIQFVSLNVTSPGLAPLITMNNPTTLTGATNLDIYITQLNSAAA
jgi:hypothetical protein